MADFILPAPMGKQATFLQFLGLFHSNWSAIDLYTDYAIRRFLHITSEQAHLITSGMVFGRKARLLADLIGHSDDPNRSKLLEAFNRIRAAKRDVIAHSYIASDAITVTFLERNTSGPFKTKAHVFTAEEFQRHAQEVHDAAIEFIQELDVDQMEINNFVNAAFNLDAKNKKDARASE